AALFVLFQPRTFFVLEQSWIEPLVLAAIALTALLSAQRRGPIAAGVALGLLLASKQYSPYFALPLFLTFPKEGRWRSLLVAAGVAAAVLVPFAVWDWHGFWRGLVTWHLLLTSRDDALSLMALWNRHGGAPAFAVAVAPFLGLALLAATLRRTVAEIDRSVADDLILVDDQSKDGTVRVAQELGLHVVVHPKNRGYGGNQKTCYTEALKRGADIVVMLHPDYQYSPRLLPAMAAMVASGHFDAVLGSRILGVGALKGGMPLWKYVANRALTFWENLLLGYKLA